MSAQTLFAASCVLCVFAMFFAIAGSFFALSIKQINADFVRTIVRDELKRAKLERAGSAKRFEP